jgi:hypothetical protein
MSEGFSFNRRLVPESKLAEAPAHTPLAEVQTFDELTHTLLQRSEIAGSEETTYQATNLLVLIKEVREGDLHINALTRAEGLRDTVSRLMIADMNTRVATAHKISDLHPLIATMRKVKGVWNDISPDQEKLIDLVASGELIDPRVVTQTNGLRERVITLISRTTDVTSEVTK